MIEKVKEETTLPIVKSAHVLIRAWTREKVSLRSEKCLYSTHRRRNRPRQRPPDDAESRKGKKSPYGYSDIILLKKNAPKTKCQGAYLHKNFAARTPYKISVPVPRQKYEKTPKILCQNCVASLFLLIFLTFCVVRDHEAMGSNPVTPTIKNTHALFALCVFYLPVIDVTKKSFSVNGFIAENSQKGKKM